MILGVWVRTLSHIGMAGGFSLLALSIPATGQSTLLTARQALTHILEQRLPACPNALRSVKTKQEDATFLLDKLQKAGWGKVGPEYVASLNDLAAGLREAVEGERNNARCERIRLILNDLHLKRRDCEILGHSRVNIPVEIATTRTGSPVAGLEVYVRWIPAGDHFDTEPKRLKNLSNPASGTVPVPGEFEVFARDPATGESSQPQRLSIGGSSVFSWELPVRFEPKAQTSN
jgi:hypothetical protein